MTDLLKHEQPEHSWIPLPALERVTSDFSGKADIPQRAVVQGGYMKPGAARGACLKGGSDDVGKAEGDAPTDSP
jgi:hypothetical protein